MTETVSWCRIVDTSMERCRLDEDADGANISPSGTVVKVLAGEPYAGEHTVALDGP